MTAVAPPLTLQSNNRLGWSASGDRFGAMESDDVTKMFNGGPRKTAQRQNSSSSIASTNSSTSTISASSTQTTESNGASSESGVWGSRKKPSRGLWPPGKAEPAMGITTARTQPVSVQPSILTASSAISALQQPVLPSQKLANGATQTNGVARGQPQGDLPPAILHLLPMNGTFERKNINVPYYPDVLRIGRQTNQKTIPTPSNGYFDSKVLSRQHAEVWADRQGRVFIRDVKSSNGTFVNGMRLSQENKESEPRELREQDILELGIDIVSEDQKTVVHHKVAAKVEHSGVYGSNNDVLNFGDLDPSSGAGLMGGPHHVKRTGNQGSMSGRVPNNNIAVNQQGMGMGMGMGMSMMNQPQHMRNWLNPITTEHIVKKLNAEMKLAMQQSQDLAHARQAIESILGGKIESPLKDTKASSDRSRYSPTKSKLDLMTHFSEPPAPPPQAPLPEKPDVARALADPIIQPLLRRSDTARPPFGSGSPTRNDHSSDILRLCEELKLAKGELSSQSEKMKSLETQLAQERTARESAEERAQQLERRDSPTTREIADSGSAPVVGQPGPEDLVAEIEMLHIVVDDMKQQMEEYRRRADTAETERNEAHVSLAQLVQEKRRENSERIIPRTPPETPRSPSKRSPNVSKGSSQPNGRLSPIAAASPTSETLLERAGIEEGQPITQDQAKILTTFLAREVLRSEAGGDGTHLAYYGPPMGGAAAAFLVGVLVMSIMNGWAKVDR